MNGRHVDLILAEWRACERKLEAASDDDREEIASRIATLREEHRTALVLRQGEAHDLGEGFISRLR